MTKIYIMMEMLWKSERQDYRIFVYGVTLRAEEAWLWVEENDETHFVKVVEVDVEG